MTTVTGTQSDDVLVGSSGDDFIFGFGGQDTLLGLDGTDVLVSDAGNDLLDGGSGADIMNGGGGNDTYVVDDAADQVIEAPSGARDGKVQTLTVEGVHLCCNTCVTVVKDVLAKVEGVTANTVAARQPTFTVSGNFEPKLLFERLNQAGLAGKVGAPGPATRPNWPSVKPAGNGNAPTTVPLVGFSISTRRSGKRPFSTKPWIE